MSRRREQEESRQYQLVHAMTPKEKSLPSSSHVCITMTTRFDVLMIATMANPSHYPITLVAGMSDACQSVLSI